MCADMWMDMCTCMCSEMCADMCKHACTDMCMHMCTVHRHAHVYRHANTCVYAHVYRHANTCVCTHVYRHLYSQVYVYVYTHVHRHASRHVYRYVYTHVCRYYLHPKTRVPRALENANFAKIDKMMWNRFLWDQSFPTICDMPSFDNVALVDFCSARLHYFAKILGYIIPMPAGLAILWDYTSIPWAHYGSWESSRVALAPKKIKFYYFDSKIYFRF